MTLAAVVVGRQVNTIRVLADETDVALAEAAEALSIMRLEAVGFDALVGRLGRAAHTVTGPRRATAVSVRLMRQWWSDARPQDPRSNDVTLSS